MDSKFEINRLCKDDLAYELKIRGIDEVTTIESMRKSLRLLLKLEKNPSFVLPKYPFKFEEDQTAIGKQITDIKTLLGTFADLKVSKDYKKIETKILHTIGRVNRSLAVSTEQRSIKSQFLVQLVTLQSDLQTKAKSFKISSTMSSHVMEMSLHTFQNALSDVETSDTDSDREPVTPFVKSVPVLKWDVKFSGDVRHMSVNSFLERVDELRVARNVSKQQLLCTAIDLFVGSALIWYRANRHSFNTWDELVDGLKLEFLPVGYEEKLLEEIKRRTQGPHEPIGIYLAVMSSLFNRLRVKFSEEARVHLLLRNISPFYQTQLGLVDVKSVAELLRLCRRLEERKESVEAYVPPPRNRTAVEPDLAYFYTDYSPASTYRQNEHSASTSRFARQQSAHNVDVMQENPRSCWNCGRVGHLSSKCREPRKKHCFKCGKPNVTVYSCPCRPGNGQ